MSGADDTESALWLRGRSGDAAAFGAIYDLHRDRVFRHAFRVLQHRADAEEAVAIAFLELWRKRRTVRVVDESVLPWLLVTTTYACRNLARARRRYASLLDSLPHGGDAPSAEEIAVLRGAAGSEVIDALNRLSPKDARLFSLIAIEDYTVADAARALGIAPGAARTRLHRIRARLRQRLGHDTLSGYLTRETS